MPRYSSNAPMFDTSGWPVSTARPESGELRSTVPVPALHRSPVEQERQGAKSAVLPRRQREERVVAHLDVDATAAVDGDAAEHALVDALSRLETAACPSVARDVAENIRRDALRLVTARRIVRPHADRPVARSTRRARLSIDDLADFFVLTRADLRRLVDQIAGDTLARWSR